MASVCDTRWGDYRCLLSGLATGLQKVVEYYQNFGDKTLMPEKTSIVSKSWIHENGFYSNGGKMACLQTTPIKKLYKLDILFEHHNSFTMPKRKLSPSRMPSAKQSKYMTKFNTTWKTDYKWCQASSKGNDHAFCTISLLLSQCNGYQETW